MIEETEITSQAATEYFSWKHHKKDNSKDIKLWKMTFCESTQAVVGEHNSIKFSMHDSSFSLFDEQYSKFIDFICESPEPYKTQLTFLAYPVFVHLYLELVIYGKKTDAQYFFNKHVNLFIKTIGYEQAVKALSGILSPQNVVEHPYFRLFRDDKYILKISEDCSEYLLRYLKDLNFLTILKLIGTHFIFEYEGAEPSSLNEPSSDFPCESDKTSEESNSCNTLAILKQCIQSVLNGPVSPPSLHVYSFENCAQNLCSAEISESNRYLVGGFDSTICLWDLYRDSEPPQDALSSYGILNDNVDQFKQSRSSTAFYGHSGAVCGLQFSQQEDFFLSCSEDTTVRLWSTSSHENERVYTGHCYPIWDIDVSPYWLYFLSASKDQTARLWTFERTYPVHIYVGHKGDVLSIKFHPNCNYFATGSSDQTVKLWSVQEGRPVRAFAGHSGSVVALAFSPDGRILASAGEDRKIKIWDLGSGSEIKELEGHTDTVFSLSFSSGGTLLASCGLESNVKIWDMNHVQDEQQGQDKNVKSALLSSIVTKCCSLQRVHFRRNNLLTAVGISETRPSFI